MGNSIRASVTAIIIGWLLNALFLNAAAAAVPPGTAIVNQATITYDSNGETGLTQDSNPVTTIVQEVIDVGVTWQDNTPINVTPGDENAILTFVVTNLGNGEEIFALAVDSNLPGDDFNPLFKNKLYLDDGDGIFDPGVDALYIPGTNDPRLDANDPVSNRIVVFVLNDIPGSAADGEAGSSKLTATATTATGTPGTILPGQGDHGTTAVLGLSGGQADDDGIYEIRDLVVSAIKSVAISHPAYPMLTGAIPGSLLVYTITVTVEGTGTAADLTVADPIPAGTTYQPGSLTLNAAPLTDAGGDDAGDAGVTTPNTITVTLPAVSGGDAPQVITFTVVIDG